MASLRLVQMPFYGGLAGAGAGANIGASLGGLLGGLPGLSSLIPRLFPRLAEQNEQTEHSQGSEASGAGEGVWLAVPKKRTSHQKKRQRQLAGNSKSQLIRNLNRCPACGHIKRAHTLCMNCAQEIRNLWRARDRESPEALAKKAEEYDASKLSPEDEALIYPQKVTQPFEEEIRLREKKYVLTRPKPRISLKDQLRMDQD